MLTKTNSYQDKDAVCYIMPIMPCLIIMPIMGLLNKQFPNRNTVKKCEPFLHFRDPVSNSIYTFLKRYLFINL